MVVKKECRTQRISISVKQREPNRFTINTIIETKEIENFPNFKTHLTDSV